MGKKKGRKQTKPQQKTPESEESKQEFSAPSQEDKEDETQEVQKKSISNVQSNAIPHSAITTSEEVNCDNINFHQSPQQVIPIRSNKHKQSNAETTSQKCTETSTQILQPSETSSKSECMKYTKFPEENSILDTKAHNNKNVDKCGCSIKTVNISTCNSKSIEQNNTVVADRKSEEVTHLDNAVVEKSENFSNKPVEKCVHSSAEPHFPPLRRSDRGRGRGRGAPIAPRPGTVPSENQQEFIPKMVGSSESEKCVPPPWLTRTNSDRGKCRPTPPCRTPTPEIPPQEIPTTTQPPTTETSPPQGCGDNVKPTVCPTQTDSSQGYTVRASPTCNLPRGGFQIPTRACHTCAGSKGRHTVVRTNHLSLNIQNLHTKTAVHYDVSVDPDKPKRLLRRALEEFRIKHFPDRYPAFDGRKNLYAATPLPFNHNLEFRDSIKVMDDERQKEKEFKIVLKYATRVDLTSLTTYMKSGTSLEAPQQAIQVLDIVLRCAPALWFVPVGRSYFTPPSGTVETLGDGYEMWYGLFQSVNLGWQPFVNVDVVHKGFPQAQSLITALIDVCEDNRTPFDMDSVLSDGHMHKLKKFLIGLKIDYSLPNNPSSKRTYKVNNVALPPPQLYFDLDSGEHISVEEYYRREKKVQLKYRNLPCLHVGSLKRQVPIYLPLEFCSITGGQVTQKKLSDRQTASMIRKAATSTMDRERKIKDALVRARFSTSPQVQEFGFRVTENFQEVKARVLDPPKLEYRNKESLLPQRGIWQPKAFLNGKRLEKWTILVLDNRVQNEVVAKFITQFIAQGSKLGMAIADAHPFYRMDSRKMRSELEPYFRDCFKIGCELVIVVVSEKGSEYSFIKQVAELTVGVLTQCVKSSTMVKRMDYATAQNILLKVNSKLNGINHTLHDISRPKIFQKPIMIVGADVTHPSPDETKIPSVAAVCASHDPKAFQYNTQFRLQPSRMEIIQDLESIMRQHLLFFYHKTGQMKPLRILFYRDGVSEGQFQQVLDSELTAIRSACSKLERDYKPAITFLVVQKRHHTRLFPTKREDSDGKNCNVVPGTIVDSTITHPTERDFYLVSHTSIQGVIRPTKYHCLWDDNRLSEDELEEVTYFLCHLFSRCTRSVSYPAPTYYAHLAAYRARVYLSGQNLETLSDERLHTQLLGDLQKKYPMYFI